VSSAEPTIVSETVYAAHARRSVLPAVVTQLASATALACATALSCVTALAACGGNDVAALDAGGTTDAMAGIDAGPADGGGSVDASATDGAHIDAAGERDASACAPPPDAPTAPLRPVAGELFYAQIGLGGLSLGEAALLVGPNGTTILFDVGNDSHDDDVAEVLADLTGASTVDHLVITHFHADHGDGIEDLLGRVTLAGTIVHRGVTDLTPAANDSTIERVCAATAARPSAGAPLCNAATAAPCDPASWSGIYPATACAGLATADIALGSGAVLDFVAANGFIGGDRYDTTVGPFLTDDSNGENARSVVALLRHGAFRMLLTGDLTGGGSDTDDVESFYAPRLETAAGIDALGVDVLHAGHHGRDTSTNPTWVDRLLPTDGRSRNAIMGISTAHAGSPHAEVLCALLSGKRLAAGAAWTTRVAPGGSTSAGLVDAGGGLVVVATLEGGAAYAVQAITASGAVLDSRAFRSAGACP
jgi:beta-lactamase superfamily II metal-dependent hydrolase